MTRTFLAKLTILCGAVVTALFLTVYRPAPEGLMPFGVGQAEVRAAPGAKASPNYNLAALKIVSITLQKINDNYVDPTRIDARAMLLSALDSVQKNVPEVMVEPSDDKTSVAVQVNDKRQTFAVGDVDSPWNMHHKMKEIFRFIQANMNPASDAAQVEYAAVNGILSTLDPHSVLLDPEAAKEMDINTTGKFGGIGIVIGMRKGKLSVIKLISQDTPAAKAGLKAGDHIVKINDEPTVNLTLNEAMSRLRGDPQTRVVVTIERTGVTGVNDYPIVRDEIRVSSVENDRLLKGNVGYFRVNQFSVTTAHDLKRAMERLRKQGAKAWVLDLRNNPGGLLDQAIKVTDLFVDSGTIVTTVGNAGRQREEKRAHTSDSDTQTPLAVLVNGGSASASEIVAGALKNLNRGVIVGQTSFGKGSVQVLFDNDDGSKLKLTIAQYLTPGDVSIQSVGITPDIELARMDVPEQLATRCDQVRLLGKSHYTRESDLDAHLTSKNARNGEKPAETLKYLYARQDGKPAPKCDDDDDDEAPAPEDDDGAPDGDTFVEDQEIQFARDLVSHVTAARRSDLIKSAHAFVAQRRADEDSKAAAALAKLGLDWSTAPAAKGGAPRLTAAFTTDKPGNRATAGEVVTVTGTVTNGGTAPAYRVHAHMKTDDYAFDERELVFGRIDPGQQKTFTALIKVPLGSASRMDEVDFVFDEANAARVDAPPLKLAVEGKKRPVFAHTYQLIDDGGNGDGLLQVGEKLKLHVTVKNLGWGKSYKTTAMLSNKSGDGVVVNKGRFEFESIAPGETKTVDFTFDVKKDFRPQTDENVVGVELLVYDEKLHESVNEKLKFPLRPASAGPQAAGGTVKITRKDGVSIREGAAEDAPVVGTAKRGAGFKVTGKQGGWTRVEIEPGRPGFVPAAAAAGGGGAAGGFVPVWQVTPPTIAVNVPSLETTGARWKLSGTALDDNHVEDVFVLISNRDAKIDTKKVLYRSNRSGKDGGKLDFAGDIPVWPGNNMITVVARENNQVRSMQTVFIYRTDGVKKDGASAAAK